MLELWFDFACPYAYLASRQTVLHGLEVDWRPMLLGGVFRGIAHGPDGNGPMATLSPPKARHNAIDMHRWADLLGAPFQVPAAHPMRTVRALRTLIALPAREWPRAIHALFAAYWARAEDLTSDAVITAALVDAGFAESVVASALAAADTDAIKDALRVRTDEAISLGIFGAPAWVLRRDDAPDGRVLVWGQDRLPWVLAVRDGWNPDLDAVPPGGVRSFVSPADEAMPALASRRPEIAVPRAAPGATLDVYYDVSSPFGYLALSQLPSLVRATGVTPTLHPILLGGLFRDIGQVDVPLAAMPAAKQRYVLAEMKRWARWAGIPFEQPTKFPQRTIAAQRLACLAAGDPRQLELAIALGRGMWSEQRDLEDPESLRAIVVRAGFPAELVERTAEPAAKQALIANTARAKELGAFGVPTLIVNGTHLFWGQDRLELVARALAGWAP